MPVSGRRNSRHDVRFIMSREPPIGKPIRAAFFISCTRKPFSPLGELRFDSRLSLHKGLRVRLHPGHGTLLRTAGRAARSHGVRDQRTRPRQ